MHDTRRTTFDRKTALKLLLAFLLGVLVFAGDYVTHAQAGLAGLYVVVVLMLVDTLPKKIVLTVCIVCFVLATGVFFTRYHSSESSTSFVGTNICVFGFIAYFVYRRSIRDANVRNLILLLEQTYDAIVIRDRDDTVIYWSDGAERLYGWSGRQARGKLAGDLLGTVYPQTKFSTETEFLRVGKWEGELSQTSRDGRQIIVSSHWLLQRDAKGQPSVTVEANRDVTHLHGLEAEAKSATQFDDFRGAMLAQMTSSISHELSQPLAASIISAEASLRWLQADPPNAIEAKSAIESAIISSRRAGDVIARVRQMADRDKTTCETISTSMLVKRALSLNQDLLLRRRVEPELAIADWLPEVHGNRKLVVKVIADLVTYVVQTMPPNLEDSHLTVNARTHVSEAGVNDIILEIGTRYAVDNYDRLAPHAKRPDGFANDVLGSTLSVCRFVIESHSWRIDAISDAKRGVAFRIKIPIKKEAGFGAR